MSTDGREFRPLVPLAVTDAWRKAFVWLLASSVFAIPLVVSLRGEDSFRYPKELLLRAAGIAAIALFASAFLTGGVRRGRSRHFQTLWAFAAAGVLWTAVATSFSSNRELSVLTLFRVSTCVLLLLLAAIAGRTLSFSAMNVPIAAATINGALAITQRTGLFNPFDFPALSASQRTTAFLGNPNDVGAYLVLPFVLYVTAMMTGAVPRVRAALVLLIIGTALLVSSSLSAILAVVCGVAILLLMRGIRGQRTLIVLIVLLVVVAAIARPLRDRVGRAVYFARMGNIDYLLSGRTAAFGAAWQMVRAHPIAGTGPGTFGANYLRYRDLAKPDTSSFDAARAGEAVNFGEAHNDHLQVMAEAGLPAYAIVFAFALYMAKPRPATARESRKRAFARHFLPAAVVSSAMLSLASFPLQLASTCITYSYCYGLALAWLEDDDDR